MQERTLREDGSTRNFGVSLELAMGGRGEKRIAWIDREKKHEGQLKRSQEASITYFQDLKKYERE